MAAGMTCPHRLLPTCFLSLPALGGEGGPYFIGPGLGPRAKEARPHPQGVPKTQGSPETLGGPETLEAPRPWEAPRPRDGLQLTATAAGWQEISRAGLSPGTILPPGTVGDTWDICGRHDWRAPGIAWVGPGTPLSPHSAQDVLRERSKPNVSSAERKTAESRKCPQQKFPTDPSVQLKEREGGPERGPAD